MIEEMRFLRWALVERLPLGGRQLLKPEEGKKPRYRCRKVLRIWCPKVEGIVYMMAFICFVKYELSSA